MTALFAATIRLLLMFGAFALSMPAAAQEAQTILHLLDYVGVDYANAVADGAVKRADEYREMLEFTSQISTRVAALPDNPRHAQLVGDSAALAELVVNKAAPAEVGKASAGLRWAIVEAYKVPIAPRLAPDIKAGAVLYTKHCIACHGLEGRGDGPKGKGLDPPPANFHDAQRMSQRSVYGLYNTITLGVQGTAMESFKQLSEEDRWSLAFYAASVGIPANRIHSGEQLWRAGKARAVFPDFSNVATLSTEEITARHGEEAARVQDYLRANPDALRPAPIAYSRQKLAESLGAMRNADRASARQAAIGAYLEGFELVENPLSNVDAKLMRNIEREMIELRAAIERNESVEAYSERVQRVDALLARADQALAGSELSPGSAFTASLIILLREGLEAILVLTAIIAFVKKTGRADAMPYVHAGWASALALGAATWMVATYLFEISGANRELTEGITALATAAMLLYVGWWLHGKSYAQAWTNFISEQVGQALARRTLWAMAAVSFLAVYREVFEIVLFYQALWAQVGESARTAVLAGIAAAAALLAATGYVLMKYSVRLPIGPFFSATSALLALLAVIFAGHGTAALQEAGVIGATPLRFEPIHLLGIYPSVEALGAQLVVILLVAGGYLKGRAASGAVRHA